MDMSGRDLQLKGTKAASLSNCMEDFYFNSDCKATLCLLRVRLNRCTANMETLAR